MSKRLLVVDDEPNLLRAVAACLKAEDYEVSTARSGHEALMQLAETLPDLIISDIRMPGMDGYEVARQIRRRSEWNDRVLIALTGWGQAEDRKRSSEAGFDHHLLKPADIKALMLLFNSLSVEHESRG